VDAVLFLVEVEPPVVVEVAVAAQGAELEDGFGAGKAPAGAVGGAFGPDATMPRRVQLR
jgi:hypothetical protein